LIAVAEQDQRWRVLSNLIASSDMVIDAVFGTGFRLPIKGTSQDVLKRAAAELAKRAAPAVVVAVDCPSGLDCDTGEIASEAIRADLTVSLAAAKVGLFKFPGANYVGELSIGDIGLDPEQEEIRSIKFDLADESFVNPLMPPRPRDSHKGTFGTVVITAGSINFPGAAVLAGTAAYRIGAGLVTLATVKDVQLGMMGALPEATWLILPDEMGVIAENAAEILQQGLRKATALLIGPGFGTDRTTRAFLDRLLTSGEIGRDKIGFLHGESTSAGKTSLPPCVVDADGLKLLAGVEDWPDRLPQISVLTPHPGEMSNLTGLEIDEIQSERVRIASEYARQWRHVVILKGAFTIVAAPDGRQALIPFATSALAHAGTGDVLSGMVAGLVAQGMEPYSAAVLGAYLHGRAGELAAAWHQTTASVMAGDVADFIPLALTELTSET
ncbi:MAG: NAD(P)H-hydrate dehydratase, partial [Anaerolineales bacterium]